MPTLRVIDRPYPSQTRPAIVDFVRSRGHELRPEGNNFVTNACPAARHEKAGHHPVTLYPDRQSWYCHDCKQGGSAYDWVMLEKGVPFSEAAAELGAASPKIVATYDYKDENGELLFQCVRYNPKDFKQRHPDGSGDWIWNLKGVRRVLYRLPELIQDIRNGFTIFVVEGEKDVNAMRERGLPATCNPLGAGKWTDEYTAILRGADVVVIADKDKDGRSHAQTVATRLYGNVAGLRVIELPEKDPALFFENGGNLKNLISLSDAAPHWQPRTDNFPLLQEATFFLNGHMPEMPPQLVRHLLHQGSKMVVGGTSKARKSMTLIDLAVSVATGTDWWGFKTHKTKICYINFEIQDAFFWFRVEQICAAKGLAFDPNTFYALNLRGHAEQIERLRGKLLTILKPIKFGFVAIDPIYKALGSRDENKAGDVAAMLNEIEKLAVETGAAVAFGAHYSKGNQSSKDHIDRIGGSGVFARDPDTILTMTAHEELDCFTVDATLRNFAPISPFVVKWEWPLFKAYEEGDPQQLKRGGQFQVRYTDEMILDELSVAQPTKINRLKNLMKEVHDMSKAEFYRRMKRLVSEQKIKRENADLYRISGD